MFNDPVEYSPEIIQEFAHRLYRQANSIIAAYIFLGLIIGAISGGIFVAIVRGAHLDSGTTIIIGAIFGAAFGYARGREKAFDLKLKAQLALCQIQIEMNTRQ